MKGKSKKKKTPLYEQFGFKSEKEFRERYPEVGKPKKKSGRTQVRGIN